MDNGFDERRDAVEAKLHLDSELKFKAQARRNKLLAAWAAELQGISGDGLDAYTQEVIRADFEEVGDDDVLRKVAADLEGKASTDEVRAKMDELLVVAAEQLQD